MVGMMSKPSDHTSGGKPAARTREADEQGDFLSRWSRRKGALKRGDLVSPEPHEATELAPAEMPEPPSVERPPETLAPLTDADMPPLEELGEGSDFKGFLSPEVSKELRRAALRKLWSQSRFNVVDGLDDYDDDFTAIQPLGDIVTSDMRYRERTREAREAGEAQRREQQARVDAEREAAALEESEQTALADERDANTDRDERPEAADADGAKPQALDNAQDAQLTDHDASKSEGDELEPEPPSEQSSSRQKAARAGSGDDAADPAKS